MMTVFRIVILLLLCAFYSYSQADKHTIYTNALTKLDSLAKYNSSFMEAVLTVESAYDVEIVERAEVSYYLQRSEQLIKSFIQQNPVKYKAADSNNVALNYAIFHFLSDTITVNTSIGEGVISTPYRYDFNDYSGNKDWHNMLVSKLITTHTGNCHSLPYLYKILADDLGAKCWLSLAPNHMYIKNRCKRDGWYNTELTNGTFPLDAWIMGSGYIPLEAVQNGIFMDTLSNQQAIALCVLDLAKGYEFQTKNYQDSFILKCCDLSLLYFPLNVQAMLLKAETLKRVYEMQKASKQSVAKETYAKMEAMYAHLAELGYREMPEKMYQKWLFSVEKEKAKASK